MCQRSTGLCKCFDGYEGSACQRRTCPGGPTCSGRGVCKDMSKLARTDTALPLRSTTSLDHTYYATEIDGATWDGQSLMACVCDSSWDVGLGAGQTQLPEFFGPSCQLRRCPSGNDPTTGMCKCVCMCIYVYIFISYIHIAHTYRQHRRDGL